MKVLHVVSGMDPKTGGVCQAIKTIINGLDQLEIHNEVVSGDVPDAPYLSEYSFRVHTLGPKYSSWQYSDQFMPWLIKNLGRFDIVIVHGLWLYHSYATRKAMQRLKQNQASTDKVPKLYIMPHGMLDPWFQEAKGRKLKAIRNWLYWKLIEDKVVNDADGMLFTCQEELLQARKPFRPYQPNREINVGYGIANSPAYTPAMQAAFLAKCPEVTNQPYLLFLSRIHMKKGLDLLINAYILVLEKSRKANVQMSKLVIAGPGQETAYGQNIQQLVANNPVLKNQIFFPGMLTGDAKWGAFYGCSAFVLSSHQENFGIAVVEALSCGKPVLISNQVNIWREIESNAGGFVGPNSIEGTQRILEKWLDLTIDEKLSMQEQARHTFEEYFNMSPAAIRMAEAINT